MAKLFGQNAAIDFAAANLMSFGKSFSRLNGQPLDKSEAWYDLQALRDYALTDAAYVGQKVFFVDVENSTVTHYGIEVDGSLKELGTSPIGDEKTISVAEDGTISLANIEGLTFSETNEEGETVEVKYQPLLTADGITWIRPSTITVEGLQTVISDLSAEVTSAKADIAKKANSEDVYTKTETTTAIASAIADIDHTRRVVVAEEEVASYAETPENAAKNVIYMVKVDSASGDVYKEYMRFDTEDGAISFEQIGDTSVDLSNYVTESEMETALADKANVSTTDALAILIQSNTDAIATKANATELEALKTQINESVVGDISALQESIATKADASALSTLEGTVNSVIGDISALQSSKADASTVTSLQEVVNTKASQADLDTLEGIVEGLADSKVDKVFSEVDGVQVAWTLLSPTNAAKLDQLSISEDGSVGISGTVAASKVEGLADWVTGQRESLPGLLTAADESKLDGIEAGAQANLIEAIKIAGESEALAINNKVVELPIASATLPGLVKLSNEFKTSSNNELEVNAINIDKLIQTEDVIFDCGGAAARVYQ